MARDNIFSSVRANKPKRHRFNLNHSKKFDCDMGQLIPVCCKSMVPGDLFKINVRMLLRFNPMLAPIMQNIKAKIWFFFVPYRILDDTFEDFITGGEDGKSTAVLPRWNVSNNAKFSLWDYLGFPVGVKPAGDSAPLDYPRRAYNLIWNEYFRDENIQDEVELTNESILYKNWDKDYFTSALPWTQRGDAPAFPIQGQVPLTPNVAFIVKGGSGNTVNEGETFLSTYSYAAGRELNYVAWADENLSSGPYDFPVANLTPVKADLGDAVSFDYTDVRYVAAVQRWMELSARFGARYTEYLRGHYGVAPRDERLQRPEWVGSCTAPIVISEVLQTSATDTSSTEQTPQANMAGHGISSGSGRIGSYFATEFGVMVGLMSIIPTASYCQGIDREWLYQTRFDFYDPAFAFLSEQEIYNEEIFASADASTNLKAFGFQGRYDELRVSQNKLCGSMRDTLDYWHLGRIFPSAPALNDAFLECKPDKRIFAVTDEDTPGLIVDFGNLITAYRPLPSRAIPGLIDHVYGA